MRCSTAQKLITQRNDGRPSPPAVADLPAHLARCSACRAFEAGLADLAPALRGWSVPEPRTGYTARFAQRLADVPQRPSLVWSWGELLRPARLAAAGAALAAGVALAVLAHDEPPALAPHPGPAMTDTFETLPPDSAAARYLAMLPAGGAE